MSLFEFLMVLVSLIVGLGLTEVLKGSARMIRSRDSLNIYWVHIVLILTIFIALLQQWWEIWGLRDTPEWTFPGLLMMMGGPVGLYLIAHLLFPKPLKNSDLTAYYYGPMRPVWLILVFTVVIASAFRPLIMGTNLFALDNATSFGGVIVAAVLALSTNKSLHAVILPLFFFGLLADVMLVNFAID